jgi:hypothetical protein
MKYLVLCLLAALVVSVFVDSHGGGRDESETEILERESVHYGSASGPDGPLAEGAQCWRCNTVWGTKDTEYHEWHRRELNMMMYASGCKRCRYHGAYKDMEIPAGHRPAELGPWPRK